MKFFRLYFILLPILILLGISCEPEKSQEEINAFNREKVKVQFVTANQKVVMKENDEMDYFQKSHKMPFIRTNSGIRYYVYSPSTKGDSIREDDIVKINYKITLLDGTACYASKKNEPKEFMVGMENVEDGLHKAVVYLKSGDKALIMIPSHLAHGLLGDQDKIPPQSPILYDIEILSVKKNSKATN